MQSYYNPVYPKRIIYYLNFYGYVIKFLKCPQCVPQGAESYNPAFCNENNFIRFRGLNPKSNTIWQDSELKHNKALNQSLDF